MKEHYNNLLTKDLFRWLERIPTRVIYLFILLISLVFLLFIGLLGTYFVSANPEKISPKTAGVISISTSNLDHIR